MADARTTKAPKGASGPFQKETRRQSDCMILWIALCRYPPSLWALADRDTIGLNEKFVVEPNQKGRIVWVARGQNWISHGAPDRLSIEPGTTIGDILNFYGR